MFLSIKNSSQGQKLRSKVTEI